MITQAETRASNNDKDANAFKQAARKWRRLQEELEDEMLKSQTTGTTFQRKRRVDVTLAMSDLIQRQRRRINPSVYTSSEHTNGVNGNSKRALADNLDSSIASFLTKCSLGNPIDKETVESIFKFAYGGSTDRKFALYSINLFMYI